MSVLVLGGTGFIGKNLVVKLLKTGERVKVFSRGPTLDPNWLELVEGKNIEFMAGDLSTFTEWESVLEDVKDVFHLAGSVTPHLSDIDPAYDIQSNLTGTINFLQHCIRYPNLKIIFCSSGGTIYGGNDESPVSEDAPTDPVCSYGIVKLAIEKYLGFFKHRDNLDSIVLRPSNVYGPWQDPSKGQGIIGIFFQRILKDLPIQIYGDGENIRDYLFIDDLVDAMLKATGHQGKESVFNIGSGQGHSIDEVVGFIEDVTQKKANIQYLASRPFDARHNVLNIEKACRLLNWKPQNGLKEGLRKTHEWLAQNHYSRYSIEL